MTAVSQTSCVWLCTCWMRTLQLVKVVRYWRGDFPTKSPFDDETLVVAYSAWAELTCFMQPNPNWEFPRHIFDLHTAYLATSNILLPHDPDNKRKRERKNLAAACRAFGITGWENIDKPAIAEAIGQGRWREYGKEAVLNYCEEDVRNSTKLLRAMLHAVRSVPAGQGRARSTLVQLQREVRRPNPSPRHAD